LLPPCGILDHCGDLEEERRRIERLQQDRSGHCGLPWVWDRVRRFALMGHTKATEA
jgi:hypothetical protein